MTNKAFIVGCIWTCGAIWLLMYALKQRQKYEPSKTWPTVEGRIITSEIWLPKSQGDKRWQVKFQYEVDGTTYTSMRPALYTIQDTEMLENVEVYKTGQPATIFYNPDKHKEGVLIPGGREKQRNSDIILAIIGCLVGIALMAAGYLGLIG